MLRIEHMSATRFLQAMHTLFFKLQTNTRTDHIEDDIAVLACAGLAGEHKEARVGLYHV